MCYRYAITGIRMMELPEATLDVHGNHVCVLVIVIRYTLASTLQPSDYCANLFGCRTIILSIL